MCDEPRSKILMQSKFLAFMKDFLLNPDQPTRISASLKLIFFDALKSKYSHKI